MVQQNNSRLIQAIRDEGCLFLVYLKIAEIVQGHNFTASLVNLLYRAFFSLSLITDRCRILKPDDILEALDVPIVRWVRHESVDYKARPDEYVIEKYETDDHTHFVLRLAYDLWDPLGESNTVKTGRLTGKTVVRIQT